MCEIDVETLRDDFKQDCYAAFLLLDMMEQP